MRFLGEPREQTQLRLVRLRDVSAEYKAYGTTQFEGNAVHEDLSRVKVGALPCCECFGSKA